MESENLGTKSFVVCLVTNVDPWKKGTMNLCSNNESMKFLLCGAWQPCKGKFLNVPQVTFDFDVPQNVPTFDVGYESKEFYDNIFENSTNGGKLGSCYDLGGSRIRAIELFKN